MISYIILTFGVVVKKKFKIEKFLAVFMMTLYLIALILGIVMILLNE